MWIRGIELSGFRDLPSFKASELGQVVGVCGPSPAATAVGDAIALFFAALDSDALRQLLVDWGALAPDDLPDLMGNPLPEQVTWHDGRSLAHMVEEGRRDLRVRLELQLDPPTVARLRQDGARDPRLAAALVGGPIASVEVGALFTRDFDAIALSIQGLRVGREDFPTGPAERPAWMLPLLRGLVGRFRRHGTEDADALAERVLEAALSWDRYGRYRAWQEAMGADAADGAEVRAARGVGEQAVLLLGDRPLSRWGQKAVRRAAQAADVYLDDLDLLWVETDDAWVEGATRGESCALEQVWRVHGAGALVPVAIAATQPVAGARRKKLDLPRRRKIGPEPEPT
jgi:hypothetical protein